MRDLCLDNYPFRRLLARLNETGYKGRKGLYELLVVTEPVRELINIRAPSGVIRAKAQEMGMRTLLDVISLKDTQLVKGSHGRLIEDPRRGPLVMSSRGDLLPEGAVDATDFKRLVLAHVFAS